MEKKKVEATASDTPLPSNGAAKIANTDNALTPPSYYRYVDETKRAMIMSVLHVKMDIELKQLRM
jgi:hypothetical protein